MLPARVLERPLRNSKVRKAVRHASQVVVNCSKKTMLSTCSSKSARRRRPTCAAEGAITQAVVALVIANRRSVHEVSKKEQENSTHPPGARTPMLLRHAHVDHVDVPATKKSVDGMYSKTLDWDVGSAELQIDRYRVNALHKLHKNFVLIT